MARVLAWAAIASGVMGTTLLFRYSDTIAGPSALGWTEERARIGRWKRRMQRIGFALLMLSFLLQGGSLAASG